MRKYYIQSKIKDKSVKVKYLAAIAISSLITVGFSVNLPKIANINSSVVTTAQANPCAAKKNPCAAKFNPCAAKANPCAAKKNPCAAKAARHPMVYTENGVARDGQDVVAYFTQKRPVQGNKNFTHRWNGATWQFSSASHRDLFVKNPQKYAPQYGGYCAKAASDGYLATTVPSAWEVRNGKLYLNFSADAQKEWLQNTPQKIVQANRNFPRILNNETLFR